MPLNALPPAEFFNREDELKFLRLLSGPKQGGYPSNILLEGARGVGKTELLKQIYREKFWGEGDTAPFYYAFRSATLQAGSFARDYFSRFVRQYVAFVKKSPSFVENLCMPLSRLIPLVASPRMEWLVDLIDNFQTLLDSGSVREQMIGAIAAPVVAARESGAAILVVLDDFPLADSIYEMRENDSSGLAALFEGSMKNPVCPHILTGSPEGALERMFSDNALSGGAERVTLGPLPRDSAISLLESLCEKMEMPVRGGASQRFMNVLGGNPLYLRNIALALRRMQKTGVEEKDLWDAYCLDVTEGQTAFYWSSILGRHLHGDAQRNLALELLMRRRSEGLAAAGPKRLAALLGEEEPSLKEALEGLERAGIDWRGARRGPRDEVFEDVIAALYMKEREGRTGDKVRAAIGGKYSPAGQASEYFEIVIPMTPDAELVAARALEQIGTNIGLGQETISQLQTALIEACINAIEHSGSNDRKLTVKFVADGEKIELSVESPGRFFDLDRTAEPPLRDKARSDKKRGWGLKLMKKVMDQVKVERADDLTRVILIKNIKRNEVLK